MRKLIMWNLLSVDGCFDGPEPWALDWFQCVWGEELRRFSIEQLQSADMLLFGRLTYEGMAAYWQTAAPDEIAAYMNSLPKVVVSRTLETAAWNNSTIVKADAMAAVLAMKQEGDGNIFVFGSGNLSRSLMEAGLFDEYRFALVPVVLGSGRLLFESGQRRLRLTLLEERRLAEGCILLRYEPRRERLARA